MTKAIEPEVVNNIDSLAQDMRDTLLKCTGLPPEFLGGRPMENVTPTTEQDEIENRVHELEKDVTQFIHGILEANDVKPVEFTSSSDTVDADISCTIPQNTIGIWSNPDIQTEAVYETSNYPLSYYAEQDMLGELKDALSDNWQDQNKYDTIYLILQKYKLVR